ncbi:hypothetical protein RR46_09556 [Papilio xuthus]|uniref:Uncharacterized protein n=1 Tax=Papilio xuthus TaxID=66420 RepID=A0A194Q4K5_PAPXU|nr:hypothetical protein RR46_09556 [Papilio xuthus]
MDWQEKAQDRRLWRSLVSEAKTHFGSMRQRSSGIVEVNLYMQPKSRNDNITIKVYKVAKGLNTIVGAKTISPRSKDFKSGWETVKISLSGFGTFMGRLLLMGKAAQDSIVLIDSFRYIPPAYDESLCLIYDSSLYIDDSTTEFLYTTTLEETKDQITQESDPIVETSEKTTTPFTKIDNAMNMLDSTTEFLYTTTLEEIKDQITQESSDPIVETSDKTTTPFTKTDNAMNMLDSTTQFLYTTTSEETKDIQTTKEASYSYTTIISNTTLDMYITDFPTKPEILTIETTSQQDDKDWDNSLTQSTTMVPKTIGDENDAFTLAPTNSKNKIETLTERNVATFLPETLDNSTSNIITNFRTTYTTSISSETAESISTGAIINTELTTELGSNTLKEVSDVEITTTENVNYATSLWDFNLDTENSTVTGTKGTEYTETVSSPEVSTKDELIINMINKGVTTTGPKLTTQRTKTDVTSAKILNEF